MIVIAMNSAPPAIRGELSRWFLEIKPNIFVGNVNVRIRDLLWERLCQSEKVRGAIMIYSCNTEQGYSIRTVGETNKTIVDFDGIQLLATKQKV